MTFVCLKCGKEAYYYSRHRLVHCEHCRTWQPSTPIRAAIWVLRGMPKIIPEAK